MSASTGNATRRKSRGNLGKTIATETRDTALAVDLAAILVQDDAMAPVYCEGDVVLYRRPNEELTLQPGDDVLALLPGPTGHLQLLLRRVLRWDADGIELHALNPRFPAIREHPRNAVLCGKVVGRLN